MADSCISPAAGKPRVLLIYESGHEAVLAAIGVKQPRSARRATTSPDLLWCWDAHLSLRDERPGLRGNEGRHRPPNANSRAWQRLRSYGFSDRERDENCALAIAWKHAPNPAPPAARWRDCRTTPRARALCRQAGVRISAAPSSSSLVLPPRSKRVRPGLGTTAFVLGPAWAGLSQRRRGDDARWR